MIALVVCLLSILSLTDSFGGHDHGEYGHSCSVCQCFIKYENRDIRFPVEPYGEVIYPTLDQCLTLCWYDRQRCRSIVYGIVGGNAGIICELYNASGISDNLDYHWAMDYYEPALNWPCNATFYPPQDVQVQSPEPGRARFRKEFANRPNPNYGQNFVFAQYPQILPVPVQLAGNPQQSAPGGPPYGGPPPVPPGYPQQAPAAGYPGGGQRLRRSFRSRRVL